MIPTSRLIYALITWVIFSLAAAMHGVWMTLWLSVGALIILLSLIDLLLLLLEKCPSLTRSLPGKFAVGEKGEVKLTISHSSRRNLPIEVYDGIPQGSEAPAMPWQGVIPSGKNAQVRYDVTVYERGIAYFSDVHIRVLGPLGLWKRKRIAVLPGEVKIYPNYAPVLRLALLATEHRQEQMGIVRRSRAGSSKDFHQLRDYRQGDSLSQIDWKSTSRRLQLISRDYQEQRNQSIVFLLDCGRRMRAIDGELPQFDHCLNALLLVAYVALRQGDQIAVQSFGGEDRWLPPVKGSHAMATVLNHLYDASTSSAPSDFAEAADRLMTRNRRRALVIVLTNLRGEDGHEIIPALRSMQSRHLVMLASLRERVVRDAVEQPVVNFSDALKHVASRQYMDERREILATLSAHGILTMDVTADELAVSLANRYLDIKAAGKL